MEQKEFMRLQEKTKHGDSLFPIVKYSTKIPEYYSYFPLHWHKEMEVIIVREGYVQFLLDMHPFITKAGDILILRPHTLHSFAQFEKEEGRTDTLVFDLGLVNNSVMDLCGIKYFSPLINHEIEIPFVICKEDIGYQELKDKVEQVFYSYEKQKELGELEVKAAVLLFLSVLLRNFSKREKSTKRLNQTIEKMKAVVIYIQEHYTQNISIAELSKSSNMSEYHLMRCFKQCAGMTCIEYINHCRITLASKLLCSTDLPITTIALEVGFNNISYFNKLFKRTFGITPKQYRSKV